MDRDAYYQLGKAAASSTCRTQDLATAERVRNQDKNHQLPWRYGQRRKAKVK